ncbi:MAG: sensor histidine kinase, partial [Solirubrobacterales bacterium]
LSAEQNGRTVAIEVSDEGQGMSAEELEHVFERFWRADSSETARVGGSGLGLAIVRSLVELHGGTISADSTPGVGTSFRFTLPVSKAQAQASSRRKAKARS